METSTRGKIELACHEGLSTQPYFDSVGVVTIGIGATVSEIPNLPNWPKTDSLSIPDVFDLFHKSLIKYEMAVNKALRVDITQPQFDALISLCYNIGTGGLTKSTLMRLINAKASMEEIRAAFLMWRKPIEILGRRKEEAELYISGDYQQSGIAQLYNTEGTGHIKWSKIKNINIFDYIK